MSPDTGYSFVRSAVKEQADHGGVGVTALASALGQTALTYAKKYMAGEIDLRAENLCLLCNRFGWNPLAFFALDGHPFTTPLRDVYVMESAGLTIAELLKEKGIIIENACAPIPTRGKDTQAQTVMPEAKPTGTPEPSQASNHWQMIAQSQQQVIESQRELIAMLRAELAKANAGRPYFAAVADEADMGEK